MMPDELTHNPFLILGVSSDAEMSHIQSVGKRRLMMMRLDDEVDPSAIRRIEAALESLADPIARFEWGLLAPELTESEEAAFRSDPVLSAIADTPLQDLASAYQRLGEPEDPATLSHNLGCLRLIQAVAATKQAQEGTPEDISDDLECIALWKDSFKRLQLAFRSDKFWMRHSLRAKSYADVRLSPDRVAAIRRDIESRVVEPVGEVIRKALLAHHVSVAQAYVGLLRESGFPDAFVDDTLSAVYKPLADRIEKAVATLSEELEAAGEAWAFRSLLVKFKREALPGLEVMLAVGDLPGYAEEHARDTAGRFLRNLSVKAFNTTSEIATPKEAIALAVRVADSDSQRNRYRADMAVLDSQAEAQKVKPLFDRLGRALQEGRLPDAIAAIDEILKAGGGGSANELKTLRRKVSSNHATMLFNAGLEALRRGDRDAAERMLRESRRWETVPSELEIIDRALAQLALVRSGRQSPTGCVLILIQVIAGVILAGLVGGALYACST